VKRRASCAAALLRGARACALAALLVAACKSAGHPAPASSSPSSAPTVVVQADGRSVPFRVEVALTPEEHARGLMYRSHLDPDAGMLFVFDEPRVQRFWMKNTLIPLDMIFIGPDRRIAGVVENAAPETETERMVPARSLYVLEIGGGLSARLDIHAGELVEMHGIPQP
jgi:uncharacterized membrane protein (UPF0127 family)